MQKRVQMLLAVFQSSGSKEPCTNQEMTFLVLALSTIKERVTRVIRYLEKYFESKDGQFASVFNPARKIPLSNTKC